MTPRKNCANPLEAARATLAAIGAELDDLEAVEPWSDGLEVRRRDLLARYLAARRAVEEAEIEEDLGP